MHSLSVCLLFALLASSVSIFISQNWEINVKKPVVPLQSEATNSGLRRRRVTNGYVADTGSHFLPFYTLLYVRKITNVYSICAGSIISEKFVLSAGHCFENAAEVFILAGFTSSKIESYTFFDQVPSTNVIMHPSYNATTIANDIALIRLSQNVTYGLVIQKITLPRSTSNFFNKTGIVSGFGVYSDVNSTLSNVLRYTFVRVMNGSNCLVSYGSNFFTSDKHLCIDTKGGASSCSGDSGGSLGIFENNTLTLAGIVSYGSDKGCELGNPEVYTKVSSYLPWIQNKTGIVVL
jgi:secreted trypsin-like serine protease